jgi:hypothetical protein
VKRRWVSLRWNEVLLLNASKYNQNHRKTFRMEIIIGRERPLCLSTSEGAASLVSISQHS